MNLEELVGLAPELKRGKRKKRKKRREREEERGREMERGNEEWKEKRRGGMRGKGQNFTTRFNTTSKK